MKRRLLQIAWGGAVFVIISGGLYLVGTFRDADVSTPTDQVATYAPDFSFPDATGKAVVLSAVSAKVRVVHFWASWSPYSRTELPILAQVNREFGNDVEVVAINRDTNPADGRAFLAELGLRDDLLFAYDSGDTYFTEVGGYNMPETLFLTSDGVVRAHVHGPMREDALRAQLTHLLSTSL